MTAEEPVELIDHTAASADCGGDRRSRDSEFRKRAESEDQTRIQNQIDDVADPQGSHGDGGIARTAKDRVDQKEQHDDHIGAEDHAHVTPPGQLNRRRGVHHPEEPAVAKNADKRNGNRNNDPKNNRLDGGSGRAFMILFTYPAGDQSGRSHAQSHCDCEDDRQQ